MDERPTSAAYVAAAQAELPSLVVACAAPVRMFVCSSDDLNDKWTSTTTVGLVCLCITPDGPPPAQRTLIVLEQEPRDDGVATTETSGVMLFEHRLALSEEYVVFAPDFHTFTHDGVKVGFQFDDVLEAHAFYDLVSKSMRLAHLEAEMAHEVPRPLMRSQSESRWDRATRWFSSLTSSAAPAAEPLSPPAAAPPAPPPHGSRRRRRDQLEITGPFNVTHTASIKMGNDGRWDITLPSEWLMKHPEWRAFYESLGLTTAELRDPNFIGVLAQSTLAFMQDVGSRMHDTCGFWEALDASDPGRQAGGGSPSAAMRGRPLPPRPDPPPTPVRRTSKAGYETPPPGSPAMASASPRPALISSISTPAFPATSLVQPEVRRTNSGRLRTSPEAKAARPHGERQRRRHSFAHHDMEDSPRANSDGRATTHSHSHSNSNAHRRSRLAAVEDIPSPSSISGEDSARLRSRIQGEIEVARRLAPVLSKAVVKGDRVFVRRSEQHPFLPANPASLVLDCTTTPIAAVPSHMTPTHTQRASRSRSVSFNSGVTAPPFLDSPSALPRYLQPGGEERPSGHHRRHGHRRRHSHEIRDGSGSSHPAREDASTDTGAGVGHGEEEPWCEAPRRGQPRGVLAVPAGSAAPPRDGWADFSSSREAQQRWDATYSSSFEESSSRGGGFPDNSMTPDGRFKTLTPPLPHSPDWPCSRSPPIPAIPPLSPPAPPRDWPAADPVPGSAEWAWLNATTSPRSDGASETQPGGRTTPRTGELGLSPRGAVAKFPPPPKSQRTRVLPPTPEGGASVSPRVRSPMSPQSPVLPLSPRTELSTTGTQTDGLVLSPEQAFPPHSFPPIPVSVDASSPPGRTTSPPFITTTITTQPPLPVVTQTSPPKPVGQITAPGTPASQRCLFGDASSPLSRSAPPPAGRGDWSPFEGFSPRSPGEEEDWTEAGAGKDHVAPWAEGHFSPDIHAHREPPTPEPPSMSGLGITPRVPDGLASSMPVVLPSASPSVVAVVVAVPADVETIRLKCIMNEEIRVLSVSRDITAAALHSQLGSQYSHPVAVRYKDREGDMITVRSDSDLREAFREYDNQRSANPGVASFKVFLRAKDRNYSEPSLEGGSLSLSHVASAASAASLLMTHMSNGGTPELTPVGDEGRSVPEGQIPWDRGEILGAGAFGRVYLGVNRLTGQLMAVKQIVVDDPKEEQMAKQMKNVMREIDMLRSLRHPHIVQYIACERAGNALNIMMEYVPGGSICDLLKKVGPLDENVVRIYTAQILRGLAYLHSHQVVHRDVKGANILVSLVPHVTLRLADFGAAKGLAEIISASSDLKSLIGTPYFMAPEVVRQSGHGCAADVWSVGCTVIQMLTGRPPWSEFTPITALFKIGSAVSGGPTLPPNLSDQGVEFLQLCFERAPEKRTSAEKLLEHKWITEATLKRSASAPDSRSAPSTPLAETPPPSPSRAPTVPLVPSTHSINGSG